MKKLYQKLPLTSILLFTYLFLVCLLIFTKVYESSTIKIRNKQLQEFTENAHTRKELLSETLKSMVFARVNTLEMLYQYTPDQADRIQQKIKAECQKIATNLEKLKDHLSTDPKEIALFKKILNTEDSIIEKGQAVFQLYNEGKIQEARWADFNVTQPVFSILEGHQQELATYTADADGKKESALKENITYAQQFSKLISTLIIGILIGLGVFLVLNHLLNKRKKALLEESERRYRQFVELSHEFISRIDQKGNILFTNKKIRERLGYAVSEISTMNLFDFVDMEFREYINDLVSGPKNRPDQKTFCVLRTKTGEKVFIQGSLIWEFKDNKFAGATCFFNDVTDKIELQKSLKESEQKFKHLFELAPAAMFAFDPTTLKFILVNTSAILLYGYTRDEFLQMTIMDIRPTEEKSRTLTAIQKIVNENHIHNQSYKHQKKDGTEIDVEVFASKLVLNDRPIVMSSILDITEKKQNEMRINKAILSTQEEERYEMGGELHDNVGQILAAAKMGLSQMKAELPATLQASYQQALDSIVLATDEIRNLSHRLAPVFFKEGNLKNSIERLAYTFNIPDNYEFSLYYDDALLAYPMNKDLQLNLYRIIQEGMRNILKYAQATEIKLDLLLHKNRLRLLLSDNGIGFDPLVTSNGIGHANIKRRAEFFGGKMNLYSSPGNGCEIEISIPLPSEEKIAHAS